MNFLRPKSFSDAEWGRVVDFASSFGMMILGVALICIGTISFNSKPVRVLVDKLPLSHTRGETPFAQTTPAVLPVSRPAVPVVKDAGVFLGALSAKAALVVDDTTNVVLFKKNAHETRPLASITKLMTALVLNDLSLNWATTTVVTASDIDSSSHQISIGEKYRLEDLWHIALISSSNSAIRSMVRSSGLSQEEFVVRMNKKASDLGLLSLHFVEPTGLDGGNVGNALDIARLLKEALKIDRISTSLHMGEYHVRPLNEDTSRRIWTTDWLITNWVPNNFKVDDVVGKTGYIDESGYNFAVRLTSHKQRSVRVVVLGAASNEERFSEARDLAEWVFKHYVWPDEPEYAQLQSEANNSK